VIFQGAKIHKPHLNSCGWTSQAIEVRTGLKKKNLNLFPLPPTARTEWSSQQSK